MFSETFLALAAIACGVSGNELSQRMTAAEIFQDLKISGSGQDLDLLRVSFGGSDLLPGSQFSKDQVP
jgi:hypothetical protein